MATTSDNSRDKPVEPAHYLMNEDNEATDSKELARHEIKWLELDSPPTRYMPKIEITAFDVAKYILKKMGSMTSMKLHKLLYYSQAWSLVWDDAPLFNNGIEAWANGPVIREIFSYHRGQFIVNSETFYLGNGNLLNQKQKETIDSVLDFYGAKSSQWLSELTHLEDPWKDARKGLSPNERGDTIISHDSMASYYSSL